MRVYEIFKLKNPGEPFPRHSLGYFFGARDVCHSLEITSDAAMVAIASGDLIRDQYLIEKVAPAVAELAAQWYAMENGKINQEEIADIMGISLSSVEKMLNSAIAKLKGSSKLVELFRASDSGTFIENSTVITFKIDH